jgi:C1A family cysteine protease
MIFRHTLLIALAAAVCVFAAPASAAGAATNANPQLKLGDLNPAFVAALQDPGAASDLDRLPSPIEVEVSAAVEARAARRAFPGAYSLVAEELVTTPVRDQGHYGTCWAFSNVAALESAIIRAGGKALDLSEDNLVARSGFWTTPHRRYHWGGYDFMAVAYFARWAGPLFEKTDPYPPASIHEGHPGRPVQRHVQGVVMIPGRSSHLDNDLIKQLVMDNGALSVGMYYDWPNENLSLNTSTAAYYSPVKSTQENHGVAIVGWDDAYPAESFLSRPSGDGAFLVRNSWGAKWPTAQAGGYFWVSYYDTGFARDLNLGTWGGCTSYATVEGVLNYSRNYGHDKLGVTRSIGYESGDGTPLPIWAANRFTAASVRPIVAAGFYTLSSGTPYEIWAGRSFKTLKRYAKGTANLPGYHTVKFSQPLGVSKGKKFVVAIKLTSPDGTKPLAVERRHAYRSSDGKTVVIAPATAKAGQSYVGAKRWRLVDLTKQQGMATANVCLKAFAR